MEVELLADTTTPPRFPMCEPSEGESCLSYVASQQSVLTSLYNVISMIIPVIIKPITSDNKLITMAARPFFSGRIPQELYDKVEDHLKQTGVSKTDVLIVALSAFLDFPVQITPSNPLEERVAKLEERLAEMDDLLREIPELKKSIITNDNRTDNNKVPEQLNILNPSDNLDNNLDNEPDNKLDNKPDNNASESSIKQPEQSKSLVGRMKTIEVISLLRLGREESRKIKVKLGNARNSKHPVQAGSYLITLSNDVGAVIKGKKRELMWDVYKLADN